MYEIEDPCMGCRTVEMDVVYMKAQFVFVQPQPFAFYDAFLILVCFLQGMVVHVKLYI